MKSHIIPKSFFEFDAGNSIILNDKNFPKRCRTGLWDNKIVIKDGEDLLGNLDNYGFQVLIKDQKNFNPIFDNSNQLIGKYIEEYDYTKFKLFCLSMLWRMSVSKLPELEGVSLGPHENIIKNMILNNDAKEPEAYSVNMFYFFENYTKGLLLYPVKENFEGVNVYRLQFSNFMALIKVDSQKTSKPFSAYMLCPSKPLTLIGRAFQTSAEANIFFNMTERNENKLPSWFFKDTQ